MDNHINVEDSVAFVTGGNRGLGKAFVEDLVSRGAKKVYAGVRDVAALKIPNVVPVQVDVNDDASVEAAARQCNDVTLLINNAGAGGAHENSLDNNLIEVSRRVFETNYYGVIRASQAFAPVIAENGGGGIINVISDQSWFALPVLSAYAASKSAVWSFTNALRLDMRDKGVQVIALHAGFMDTDLVKDLPVKKTDPRAVATDALTALERGDEEVLADAQAQLVKDSLSSEQTYYLQPAGLS